MLIYSRCDFVPFYFFSLCPLPFKYAVFFSFSLSTLCPVSFPCCFILRPQTERYQSNVAEEGELSGQKEKEMRKKDGEESGAVEI